MLWYYTTKNDGAKHGIADEMTLFDMAREGKIRPSDLVWNESTGNRWVPAASIEGLFPPDSLKDGAGGGPAAEGDEEPGDVIDAGTGQRAPWVVAGIVLLCAAVGGVCMLVKKAPPPPPVEEPIHVEPVLPVKPVETTQVEMISIGVPDDLAVPAASNEVSALVVKIVASLRAERFGEAEAQIAQLSGIAEGSRDVELFSARLRALKENASRREALAAELRKGELDAAEAAELLRLYRERSDENSLMSAAEGLLNDKESLSAAVGLSLARLFVQANRHASAKAALGEFVARCSRKGPAGDYLDAASMQVKLGESGAAAQLLESYVRNEADSGPAWLELAALRCGAGESKDGLRALQKAVQYGGDVSRRKAVEDGRFDSVRDTRTFSRLIRKD